MLVQGFPMVLPGMRSLQPLLVSLWACAVHAHSYHELHMCHAWPGLLHNMCANQSTRIRLSVLTSSMHLAAKRQVQKHACMQLMSRAILPVMASCREALCPLLLAASKFNCRFIQHSVLCIRFLQFFFVCSLK